MVESCSSLTLKAVELVWRTIFLGEQDRSRERNRPLHRRLLQSRPPPFGARLHQPASVRRAGSVKIENAPHKCRASPTPPGRPQHNSTPPQRPMGAIDRTGMALKRPSRPVRDGTGSSRLKPRPDSNNEDPGGLVALRATPGRGVT